MKKITFLLTCLVFSAITLQAQDKKTLDRKAIKDMCGCYEVTFNFAETFNYSNDSLYKPSETKVDKGLEWAGLITDEDNKIVIQHLLQVGNPAEPMIIKHWRQDWLFENTDLYTYNADNNWKYVKKPAAEVKGQWTQKVFQVDDSPRYEGSSSWVHVDGKHYWENTTEAPLPRREYTIRSDYNLTMRGNRVEITDFGWVHEQDNEKIHRTADGTDRLIAWEKGMEAFTTGEYDCAPAIAWWEANKDYWSHVRRAWDEIYKEYPEMKFQRKVDNKMLWQQLYALGDEEETADSDGVKDRVKELILKYLEV